MIQNHVEGTPQTSICTTRPRVSLNYPLWIVFFHADTPLIWTLPMDPHQGRRMVFPSIREHAEHCDIFCEHEQKKKICFASLRATQKFGEHEQASTCLNFASKSSKGKILRAVKNFNGPFITPLTQCLYYLTNTRLIRTPRYYGQFALTVP